MNRNIKVLVITLGFGAVIIACAVVIIAGLALTNSASAANTTVSTTTSSRPTTAKIGQLAPEISLKTMEGDLLALSKQEGHPVIVNFWATWCGPCREEFPALVRAQKKYKSQGLIILGVNTGDEAPDSAVLAFMTNTLVNFPIVRDIGDRVARVYNIRGLPTSYFVDPSGVIRDMVVGAMNDEIIEEELTKILPQ